MIPVLDFNARPLDSEFRIAGSSDATKLLAFEVDGFTTGTTRTATFPDSDIEVQGTHDVITTNWSARNHGAYTVIASATATDPGTPAAGHEFTTLVRNGTATIGGTAYATAGARVGRSYHSGSWTNYVYPHLDAAWTWTAAQTMSQRLHVYGGGIVSSNNLQAWTSSPGSLSLRNVTGYGAAVSNAVTQVVGIVNDGSDNGFAKSWAWRINKSAATSEHLVYKLGYYAGFDAGNRYIEPTTWTDVLFASPDGIGIGAAAAPSSGALQVGVNGNSEIRINSSNAATISFLTFLNSGASGKQYSINVGGNASSFPNQFFIYDNSAGASRLTLDTSGNFGIGATPTAGNGLLQLASGTTKANGIAFGTDTFLYRIASGSAAVVASSGTSTFSVYDSTFASQTLIYADSGGGIIGQGSAKPLGIRTNNVDAIFIDASQGVRTTSANYVKTRSVTASSGTTTLDATDDAAILTGAAIHTFTLPAAAVGRRLFVKNRSSGTLTVNRAGADTIDGGTTINVAAGTAKILIANGTDWCVWNA